jgi:hypothetical protein
MEILGQACRDYERWDFTSYFRRRSCGRGRPRARVEPVAPGGAMRLLGHLVSGWVMPVGPEIVRFAAMATRSGQLTRGCLVHTLGSRGSFSASRRGVG